MDKIYIENTDIKDSKRSINLSDVFSPNQLMATFLNAGVLEFINNSNFIYLKLSNKEISINLRYEKESKHFVIINKESQKYLLNNHSSIDYLKHTIYGTRICFNTYNYDIKTYECITLNIHNYSNDKLFDIFIKNLSSCLKEYKTHTDINESLIYVSRDFDVGTDSEYFGTFRIFGNKVYQIFDKDYIPL